VHAPRPPNQVTIARLKITLDDVKHILVQMRAGTSVSSRKACTLRQNLTSEIWSPAPRSGCA